MLLDRGTEMLFGKTVVARAEVFLAETQLIVWVAAEKTLHRFSRHTDLLDDCAGRVVGCLCGVRRLGARLRLGGVGGRRLRCENIGKAV
jgi:hypothetical protein